MEMFRVMLSVTLAAILGAGCLTDETAAHCAPQVVWKLPPNLGKAKNEIGIQMYAPMPSEGGQLLPGLAQQFIEAVQSKMIQSKRFHVYLPNQFGEAVSDGDADVVVKPFVDMIQQPMGTQDGREGVACICKVTLDVKVFDKSDGEAVEAINLDGVSKVIVPSVFGKPAKVVDSKGLVVKAYEEAYKLLEIEINKNFPPAAAVSSLRVVAVPPSANWRQGEPMPEPILKIATKGGANVGFKPTTKYMLFTMIEDTSVMVALLEADSIMNEKASFRSVQINMSDPDAYDIWTRVKAKESGIKFFVTPYYQ